MYLRQHWLVTGRITDKSILGENLVSKQKNEVEKKQERTRGITARWL